jgi:hypothetical protein
MSSKSILPLLECNHPFLVLKGTIFVFVPEFPLNLFKIKMAPYKTKNG